MWHIGTAVLCLSLITGCAGHSTLDSGIRGRVVLGPMCPGPVRQGVPCPDRAVKRMLAVYRTSTAAVPPGARPVASVSSDANGTFQVALPPGPYILYGKNPGYPTPCIGRAAVKAHGYAQVTVHCDTGMR